MFSRHGLSIAALTLATVMSVQPAGAGSVTELYTSKSPESAPVATKVAEFKEDFVVGGLDFSADGTQLASNAMMAGLDVHIREWRGNNHIVRVFHKTAPSGEGNAIKFSIDGSLLAVGHSLDTRENGYGLIRIWDANTGAIIYDVKEPQGASGTMTFAFLPDGKSFIRTVNRGGGPGNYLVVHKTDTWAVDWGLPTLPLTPRSLAISPHGHFATIGGQVLGPGPGFVFSPQIAIIDLEKRQIVRTIDSVFPDANQVQTLAWSPDGTSIAAGCIVDGSFRGPNAVRFFDPMTGAEIAHETADTAFVSALAYTPNGKYLIEGEIDHHVRLWDASHKSLLQTIPVNEH
ncbi:MAG: WD40 repeat domain-containing protein, partial [Steroidobacteraceae bacterium]